MDRISIGRETESTRLCYWIEAPFTPLLGFLLILFFLAFAILEDDNAKILWVFIALKTLMAEVGQG